MPPDVQQDSQGAKGLNALIWQYLGTFGRAIATFLFGIFLARLLGPAPFATVAVGLAFIGLANLLADFGLTVALIQRKEIDAHLIGFIFTLQMTLAGVLTLVFAGLSPVLASAFKLDSWQPLAALSLLFVIQAAGQTSSALLRRDLRFKELNIIQLLAYLVGYGGLGVVLAMRGYGVWSLVGAQLTQALLASGLYLLIMRPRLQLTLRPPDAGLLSFSATAAVSNMASWGIGNLPTLLIGQTLGPLSLALYNRAAMTVGVPLNNIVSVLQTVLLSIYSRNQHQPERLARIYMGAAAVVSSTLFPAFAIVAVLAWPISHLLFGHKWVGIEPLISLLAIAMPFDALALVTSPLLIGMGQPKRDFWGQVITLAISVALVGGVAWLAHPSLLVLTVVVCICVYLVRAITLLDQARRAIALSVSLLIRQGAYCLAGVLMTAGATFAGRTIASSGSELMQLLAGGCLGLLSLALFLGGTRRQIQAHEGVILILNPLFGRLPRLGRWLNKTL
ncbi:lipopolysaccharide biosynthesis protein [Deinococcus oregonensis]|uniref:Lipopolysaccharide biosynthesis protein n=1 Tax=Deinococcus oregonensis TaxID=1805970 RepID=A0ABV6B9G1_9DEIO